MTELAKRYGGSLYELAAEENLTDELLQQLRTAVNSIDAQCSQKGALRPAGQGVRGSPPLPRQLSQAAVRGGSAG